MKWLLRLGFILFFISCTIQQSNFGPDSCGYFYNQNSMFGYRCKKLNGIPDNLDKNMEVLNILDSKIRIINPDHLNQYPILHTLNITNNPFSIKLYEKGPFHSPTNLTTVELSGIKTLEIEEGSAFSDSTVKNLYLRNSKHTRSIFSIIQSRNLRFIDLTNNKIESISIEDIAPFCSLEQIVLEKNPISFRENKCDCHYFKIWLTKYKISARLSFECEGSLDQCPFLKTYDDRALELRSQCLKEIEKDALSQSNVILYASLIAAFVGICLIISIVVSIIYCKKRKRNAGGRRAYTTEISTGEDISINENENPRCNENRNERRNESRNENVNSITIANQNDNPCNSNHIRNDINPCDLIRKKETTVRYTNEDDNYKPDIDYFCC